MLKKDSRPAVAGRGRRHSDQLQPDSPTERDVFITFSFPRSETSPAEIISASIIYYSKPTESVNPEKLLIKNATGDAQINIF